MSIALIAKQNLLHFILRIFLLLFSVILSHRYKYHWVFKHELIDNILTYIMECKCMCFHSSLSETVIYLCLCPTEKQFKLLHNFSSWLNWSFQLGFMNFSLICLSPQKLWSLWESACHGQGKFLIVQLIWDQTWQIELRVKACFA